MTSDNDDPWAYYADLQNLSSKLKRVSPYAWGLDAAMSHLLGAIAAGTVPADPNDLVATLNRTIASAARLHRSRAAALSYNTPIDEPPSADDAGAEMRIEVTRILRLVSDNDGDTLVDAALGYTDREIAQRRGSTPGAVRVRLSRIRLKLVA